MNIPKEIPFNEIVNIARRYMKPEDIDHHESDLYLRCNEISREIIAHILDGHAVIEKFVSNIEPHVLWYSIWWAYHE